MAEHMRIEHSGAGVRGLYQWVDSERWMIVDTWSREIFSTCGSKEEALERVKVMANNDSASVGDWIIVRTEVIAPYRVNL